MPELSPAQKLMVEDGMPPELLISTEERQKQHAMRHAKPTEIPMTNKSSKKEAKERVAAALGRPLTPSKSKAASSTKRAPKAASSPAKAKDSARGGVRPGSKLEIIVGLLKRKQGCTAKQALEACHWSAISFNQQAAAAGITLRKEKKDGVTVYYAA